MSSWADGLQVRPHTWLHFAIQHKLTVCWLSTVSDCGNVLDIMKSINSCDYLRCGCQYELDVCLSNLTEQPGHALDCLCIVIEFVIHIVVITAVTALKLCGKQQQVLIQMMSGCMMACCCSGAWCRQRQGCGNYGLRTIETYQIGGSGSCDTRPAIVAGTV